MIRLLNVTDKEKTRCLFDLPNWMGVNLKEKDFYDNFQGKSKINDLYHDHFCYSYLSGLKTYKAVGYLDADKNILGFLSLYQSPDEPSWYGTQIRSVGGKKIVRDLLDFAMDLNEKDGRFKFYTLWSSDQTRYLRRFAFSSFNNERYDYFDECVIPANHKCFYTNYWHVLFNRTLIPIDVTIRCTFLKQQYRNNIPIGGHI